MIRRTPVPVTYVDFHAQFPSVSYLLGCREILRAESLEFSDFTNGARQILQHASLDDCFRPAFSKNSAGFRSWKPMTMLSHSGRNLVSGWTPIQRWLGIFTSKQPIWITGLDVIAAKLMTGKPLKILQAIKVVPHGLQSGLRPEKLHSQVEVNPRRDDLAVKLV